MCKHDANQHNPLSASGEIALPAREQLLGQASRPFIISGVVPDGMVLGVRSLPRAKQLEERFAITGALEVVIGG